MSSGSPAAPALTAAGAPVPSILNLAIAVNAEVVGTNRAATVLADTLRDNLRIQREFVALLVQTEEQRRAEERAAARLALDGRGENREP